MCVVFRLKAKLRLISGIFLVKTERKQTPCYFICETNQKEATGMFSGVLSKILPSLSPFSCTPLFDTPAILERSGLYFLPVLLFWKCQKGPTPGKPWVNKSSAAPVTGEASMSISLVCPPSPRWGKTLIAAFDLLILLPSSLPSPFIITRFYLFVYKYPVNENFAFSPG